MNISNLITWKKRKKKEKHGGHVIKCLLRVVQYTRTESGRLRCATVRLTGSPIAKDLEKYTEVFTEGVKC